MLVLSANQFNIPSANNTPFVQDWSPTNNVKNYSLQIGQTVIFHTNTNIKLKDVVGQTQYATYSEFRLIAYQNYSNNNLIAWINPSSYNALGYPIDINAPIAVTTTGVNYNFNPTFQNLNLLSVGEYTFTQFFLLQGKDTSGNWIDLSNYNYKINLNVYSQEIVYSPATLVFNHVTSLATPTQDVVVSGNNWTFTVPSTIIPKQPVSGVTFSINNGFTIVSGSGTKTIQFGLNDSYFDTQTPTSIPLLQIISLFGADANNQQSVTVGIETTIFILGTNALTLDVNSLNFSAIKSFQEPILITAFLGGSVAYTISAPSWLIVTVGNILNQNVLLGNISFVPIPTTSMQPGIFNDNVIFDYVFNGNAQQLIIPVTYVLTGVLGNPYGNKLNGFTLDIDYFEFSSDQADTYMEIETEFKALNRETNLIQTTNFKDILPLFNGYGKISFGERLHKLLSKLSKPSESIFQYPQGDLKLIATEKKLIDNSVLRVLTGNYAKIIAGISKYALNDTTFLLNSILPVRVYENGFAKVSFFVKSGSYKIDIIKNNSQLVASYKLGTIATGIYNQEISFENCNKGDLISIRLSEAITGVVLGFTPKFIVFPKNRYSNFISWENNFLTESLYEFGGGFSLKSDLERTETKRLVNFVEILEYLKTRKQLTFSVNTGWILKSDAETIDDLLSSKRAWLKYNSEFIDIRPLSKSIVKYNSEKELIEYSIEFQINKKSNEENYSF